MPVVPLVKQYSTLGGLLMQYVPKGGLVLPVCKSESYSLMPMKPGTLSPWIVMVNTSGVKNSKILP